MFKIYNVKGVEVPIIDTTSKDDQGYLYIAQNIICMEIPENSEKSIEEIIEKNSAKILERYEKINKEIIYRSDKEFEEIVKKYFNKYEKQLNIKAKNVYITPFSPQHLGWAYNDEDIEINSYMKYMDEEVIQLTIYHELCHLYTLKNNNTLAHNEDFHNILYQEYTKEEEKRIMGRNS